MINIYLDFLLARDLKISQNSLISRVVFLEIMTDVMRLQVQRSVIPNYSKYHIE